MLIGGRNWRQHRPWLIFTLLATGAASAWYFVSSAGAGTWPGGSSLPGFTFGVAGGLLILFELLLWGRKKVRTWRIGPVQAWMRAHIWLGLLCLPLLIYHSGFRLGGTLSTVLMVLLLVVVASGIWGLVLQQSLPRRMLNEVPAETIYSQIERRAAQFLAEADLLVETTCGPAPGEEPRAATEPEALAASSYLVVGAVRAVGRVQGRVLETRVPATPVEQAEPLRDFFVHTAAPFLRGETASTSPLRFPDRAAVLFADLKSKLPPAAHPAVAALASFCDQRRQFDEQARLHYWLHNWLWVHLPLSIALVVLMAVHVWVALKYW